MKKHLFILQGQQQGTWSTGRPYKKLSDVVDRLRDLNYDVGYSNLHYHLGQHQVYTLGQHRVITSTHPDYATR